MFNTICTEASGDIAFPSISLRLHTLTGMKRGNEEDDNNVDDDDVADNDINEENEVNVDSSNNHHKCHHLH